MERLEEIDHLSEGRHWFCFPIDRTAPPPSSPPVASSRSLRAVSRGSSPPSASAQRRRRKLRDAATPPLDRECSVGPRHSRARLLERGAVARGRGWISNRPIGLESCGNRAPFGLGQGENRQRRAAGRPWDPGFRVAHLPRRVSGPRCGTTPRARQAPESRLGAP
jgi:hypothetical protein